MDKDEVQKNDEESRKHKKKSTQDTNRIMGLAAIFISILSMVAVIYQSYLAREENELMRIQQSASVLPYLDYTTSNIDGKYKFIIENKGVGPAFIKEVKFIGKDSDDQENLIFNNTHSFYDFLVQKSSFLDSIPIIKNSIHSNMLLSPSERRELYVFSFDNYDQQRRISGEFYSFYAGLKIIYEDVYRTAWIYDSDKEYPEKIEKK